MLARGESLNAFFSDKIRAMTTDITTLTTTPLKTLTALTVDEKRARIFNVGEPFEVSAKEFDEVLWPLVSNFWVQFSSRSPAAGPWISYACRFAKLKQSSSRKEGVPSEKRRKTSVRPAGRCSAKIRVSRLDAGKRVKIERYNESPDHDHSLEDCDKLKLPKAIKDLIAEEARKRYAPPAIVNTVLEIAENNGLGKIAQNLSRIDVANVPLRCRGSEDAHLIGEDDLTWT